MRTNCIDVVFIGVLQVGNMLIDIANAHWGGAYTNSDLIGYQSADFLFAFLVLGALLDARVYVSRITIGIMLVKTAIFILFDKDWSNCAVSVLRFSFTFGGLVTSPRSRTPSF